MEPRSVVFLGTSAFAVPALRALAADPAFRIDLVITQPDRPVGRKQILTPPPVKVVADELGIPVVQPETVKSLITDHWPPTTSTPDFLIVISYGQILTQQLLDWPKIAPINVHASLLPELRGASPIQHAILLGKKETGVTVQRMVKELDAGPILSSVVTPIEERETTPTLHDRLATLGAALLVETLKQPLTETPQEEAKISHCRRLTKEDGVADPKTMHALTIDRMVRALNPWPGVIINGSKILETSLVPDPDALEVPCVENSTLYVTKIQPASGKPMTGRAFGMGRSL